MDKNSQPPGPKVSQMAHIFQKKASEDEKDSKENAGNAVMRTESHAARFNNARALFEKLGEGRINRPTTFSIKHSTSKDDNLKDPSPDRERPRSPSPKKKFVGISNGVGKNDLGMIQNVSRKSEKPEKPEKPERKFNSKELIEKQKNWTSHFSKSRSPPSAAVNRFDIIRTVPGTGVINNADINKVQDSPPAKVAKTSSTESPPSPSIRHSQLPPEIKPRTTSRSNSLTSPTKALPSIPNAKPSPEHVRNQRQPDGKCEEVHEKPARKKSLDFSNEQLTHSYQPTSLPADLPNNRRYSSDKESNSLNSPAHAVNSAASSSGPSSPSHTEDEKQENEANEKTDIAPASDDANSEGEFEDLF